MRFVLTLSLLVACGGGERNTADGRGDDASAGDLGHEDAVRTDDGDISIFETIGDTTEVSSETANEPDEVAADSYCERSVDMFCDFYVRCGRMAVADRDECQRVFLETCNGRYEPLYADLAARNALRLSRRGLERCAAHLGSVSCEQQIFDLDGCPDVWVGLHAAGEPCGPGLESFVCAEDTVCVLGLDFCGTCKAKTDGACDLERRCADTEVCRDGACVARVAVGGACVAGGPPCVLGADCVGGVCVGPTVVAEGEACGGARRCPYRSQCAGGSCVRTELAGESCGGRVGCASGACVAGRCEALGAPGDGCASGPQCVSGRCGEAGQCAAIAWSCLGP